MQAYCELCKKMSDCFVEFTISDSFKLVRCKDCELVFLFPQPNKELLDKIYSEDYKPIISVPFDSLAFKLRKVKFMAASWRFNGWGQHKDFYNQIVRMLGITVELLTGRYVPYTMAIPLTMPKDAKMMEIGSGNGHWLVAMYQMGFHNIFGNEINPDLQAKLQQFPIKLFTGDINQLNIPENNFDLIRLEHVFEHLPKPIEVLQRISTWIKSSGYILINIPNIYSYSFNMFSKHWAYLTFPQHLYHYSPKTITTLAEKCNLKVAAMRTLPSWKIFTSSLLNKKKNMRSIILDNKLLNILSPIYSLIVPRFKGELISVVLQRTT